VREAVLLVFIAQILPTGAGSYLMDFRAYTSALIVKPSSLGDIVHTLPAVHALKLAHPHLKLRWIAKPEWLPLIAGSADVDEVIPFPQKELRGPLRLWRWARQFRAARQPGELVLDFQGLLRSALISKARGSRPIVGLSDAREGASLFYDQTVPVDAAAHAVDRYLTLLRGLAVPVQEVCFPMPEGRAVGQPVPKDFVLVHPYSRGAGKSLSAVALQALCAALAPQPAVLVGVCAEPVHVSGAHITDLVGRTDLAQLLWLMRRAQRVISVDSGPMHIAAAVNDQTLGIHTWSDPRKVGPYNPRALVWKAGRVASVRDLSDSECRDESVVTVEAARAMAQWAKAD
jgi:heptosyltransferase I